MYYIQFIEIKKTKILSISFTLSIIFLRKNLNACKKDPSTLSKEMQIPNLITVIMLQKKGLRKWK